jgi:hypothetical protein
MPYYLIMHYARQNPVRLATQKITWRTEDLSIGRVESILGSALVASFFKGPRAASITKAVSLAHGAWSANERERYAAYRSLARLLGRQE